MATNERLAVAVIRRKFRIDGGAEKSVVPYLSAFIELGFRVQLICESWTGSIPDQCSIVKIKTYGPRVLKTWLFVRGVSQILEREQFKFVQSHEWVPGCNVLRLGDGLHSYWHDQLMNSRGIFKRMLTKISLFHTYRRFLESESLQSQHLEAVIVNSEFVGHQVRETYPELASLKIILHRNVVPPEFYQSENDFGEKWFGESRFNSIFEDAQLKLLFVGSGWARKGLKTLLESLAHIIDRPWTLVVIGDDKHRSQYLKLCSSLGIDERVFFAGVRQVSKDLYEQFDALVLPTAYDPFPNVIAESLVSGTRVITTSHCGGQDFADDESVLIADNQAELIDLFRSNSFDKKLSAGLIAKYRKVFSRENLRVLILEMINDSGLTYRIE